MQIFTKGRERKGEMGDHFILLSNYYDFDYKNH